MGCISAVAGNQQLIMLLILLLHNATTDMPVACAPGPLPLPDFLPELVCHTPTRLQGF